MPTLDPQLNQIIWWIVLGAFIGWLLWVLVDRFFWRDGESASGADLEQHAGLLAELENARREENLLRTELVREQEETQRLIGITKDLRDKLNGQEQIVANLEAALDAARFSAPGAAAIQAGSDQPGRNAPQPNALPPNTALTLTPDQSSETLPSDNANDQHDPPTGPDGEQALRDLLAESDFTEDFDELLGSDEDLFGAPTEVLTTRARLADKRTDPGSDPFGSSTQIRYTRPSSATGTAAGEAPPQGPMSDAELDRLLNLDTGKLFTEGVQPDQANSQGADESDLSDSNPEGHTLTMLERLRDEQASDRPKPDRSDTTSREVPDSSLIGRLRSAFSRKPDDHER